MKFLTYGSQALRTFPDGRAADVELEPLEHPGPGPDTGFRLPEIAEMIDGLLGHDSMLRSPPGRPGTRRAAPSDLTSSAVSWRPFTGGLSCQRTPRRRLKT